ncbi:uncharacterized protein LOC113358870 [Papaver somniferum]|uniref:uncharacterized protein LOC113358870 n=1 Tax=Papaver somniferum TaxID=3469 RepID=UPI000E702908|nr:uncharacterized protein LOC113358870 [Papaver somniferum]XP_026458375.1 uncharacterized protein LOC113358870 [Papaver somniferum]
MHQVLVASHLQVEAASVLQASEIEDPVVAENKNLSSSDAGLKVNDQDDGPEELFVLEGFGGGTLLVGILRDNKTAVAGCDGRSYQQDITDMLDVQIVKETVADGVFNSPVFEKTTIKYDIEPHFTLFHAGIQAGNENVLATLRNTALSMVYVGLPVNVLDLASSLHSYLVQNPDRIPGIGSYGPLRSL